MNFASASLFSSGYVKHPLSLPASEHRRCAVSGACLRSVSSAQPCSRWLPQTVPRDSLALQSRWHAMSHTLSSKTQGLPPRPRAGPPSRMRRRRCLPRTAPPVWPRPEERRTRGRQQARVRLRRALDRTPLASRSESVLHACANGHKVCICNLNKWGICCAAHL